MYFYIPEDHFNNSPTQVKNSRVSPESTEHTEQIENLKKEYIEIEDYNEEDSVEYIEIDQNELPNNDFNDQYLISDLEGITALTARVFRLISFVFRFVVDFRTK